ncbi:MAG: thioredoxin-disulfide reductase [Veillonellales bacterium]
MDRYDVIIIGSGPAGLTAALYSSRSKLKTMYIEKLSTGGQAATTDEIENYPGFSQGTTGPELVSQMEQQVKRFGAECLGAKVQGIELAGQQRIVKTNKGDFTAKTVIIASGAAPKLLGCPGELKFRARGVSYCATCDAAFYEGCNVMVIGGGDSAVEEACYLTKFAEKVSLVHRRDSLRATKIVQDKAFNNPKLTIIWDTIVQEIEGDDIVEKAILKNVVTGEISVMPVDGVFVYVGLEPNTDFIAALVETDEHGYIKTDENMRTNVSGIYAAGDVRVKLLRQIVTAAADGAIAAFHAEKYIESNFKE